MFHKTSGFEDDFHEALVVSVEAVEPLASVFEIGHA